eukprot:CAMPEP_0203965160 /NCGR_PEP_ID=MMETSP0359-20131031/94725_1 /ASSEMBLY_ACC=CAM_ASM_000338 /TAXON_ID=268821 /ORGANISM="Scrippsiella Hangoei, Strain SHTV-5" /LENGTH=76 /DNA_ID=CAMNT_0050901927 /DNA_START=42 /DNA_END=269 /DNA_ORIENTATION=+
MTERKIKPTQLLDGHRIMRVQRHGLSMIWPVWAVVPSVAIVRSLRERPNQTANVERAQTKTEKYGTIRPQLIPHPY